MGCSVFLTIFPKELLVFLTCFAVNGFPVDGYAQNHTKITVCIEKLTNGRDLWSKTIICLRLDMQGKKIQARQVGWFVRFFIH